MVNFALNAQVRFDLGKGASCRPYHNVGLVPAVVYDGDKEPQSIALELREITKFLESGAAFNHMIALSVGGVRGTVLIKAPQRRPAEGFMMHASFLRVVADHKLTAYVPLHFTNEEVAIGVRQSGGGISHTVPEVRVSCPPKDLPEFIEADMVKIKLGQIIHLSDFKVPEGVELVQLAHGSDLAAANVHAPHVVREEGSEEGIIEQFITR